MGKQVLAWCFEAYSITNFNSYNAVGLCWGV